MAIKFCFNDIESINDNIKSLVVVRRDNDLNDNDTKSINALLTILYNAKYNLLKKLYN